jgi:glucose-6-phosphate isomerase
VSFLSNIDGKAFEDAIEGLDPATTLVVVVSKTFTTAETLANMASALAWLKEAGVTDPHGRLIAVTASPEAALEAGIDETRILQFGEGVGGRHSLWSSVGISAAHERGWVAVEEVLEGAAEKDRHFRVADPDGRVIAVTAKPEAALEQAVDESRILQFGEGVGGRYSLWSTVGLSAALALGWDAFEALLEGAAEMDRHFRFAEPTENMPLIAAFADRFYVEQIGCQARAVFPYDERLRLLPAYLQQLEMESNGKSVDAEGNAVNQPTAPVTWGGTGTDAQHAVFQLLHQGTLTVPVEFVTVREAEDSQDPERRRQLLLNAFAQGAALMQGRGSDDPQRAYPGNRPSSTILIERLDARALGALIAFYEHRTFANAALLGINPFDQFGVELGKEIARQLSEGTGEESLDISTRALIERAGI